VFDRGVDLFISAVVASASVRRPQVRTLLSSGNVLATRNRIHRLPARGCTDSNECRGARTVERGISALEEGRRHRISGM